MSLRRCEPSAVQLIIICKRGVVFVEHVAGLSPEGDWHEGMVAQVLPHPRQIVDHWHALGLELVRRAYAG